MMRESPRETPPLQSAVIQHYVEQFSVVPQLVAMSDGLIGDSDGPTSPTVWAVLWSRPAAAAARLPRAAAAAIDILQALQDVASLSFLQAQKLFGM